MQNNNPKILLLGPLPPPYMGPSIATEIILQSNLNKYFNLYHLDTNTHKTLLTLGEWTLRRILRNIKLYIKFMYILIKYQPNLVLIPISQTTSGFIKDSIFILISRLFLRKTLLQLRGGNFKNWLESSSTLTKAYVSYVVGRTQGVIVLGNKLKQLFSDLFKDEQIFVVPNGRNFNFENKKVRKYEYKKIRKLGKCEKNLKIRKLENDKNKIMILFLSNFIESKGYKDVLYSVKGVTQNHTNVKFVFAGSWMKDEDKFACERYIEKEEIKDYVEFVGSVIGKDKWSLLQKVDIFIFPPREPEGHPWVIVEAMSAGLPIISTDQGAITESVIDGVNGFIVEKQNPEQIVEKIIFLIENPELRKQMGKESRRLYEENFTEEKMVERLTEAFNTVLNR